MQVIGLTGLIKIELPAATVLLCDGGFLRWGADLYRSAHPVFGTIGSVEAVTEGVGDEVPAFRMTLQPASDAAPAELSQPGFQRCRARFWLAEYDRDSGAVVGTPDLMFDGVLDQTSLAVGQAQRDLEATIVSTAERLFERNSGSPLSPVTHKSIWPGETGNDNASGLTKPVAWGVESPTGYGGGSASGVVGGTQADPWFVRRV